MNFAIASSVTYNFPQMLTVSNIPYFRQRQTVLGVLAISAVNRARERIPEEAVFPVGPGVLFACVIMACKGYDTPFYLGKAVSLDKTKNS